MSDDHYKYPRLFTEGEALNAAQVNYLKNALRKQPGDRIRIFDGKTGEYFAEIQDLSKKSGSLKRLEQLRQQPTTNHKIHLLFAPLKKNRMDFIIEKCTELGITDFHPVLTNHTETRILKSDRLRAQIIEACEQSERLEIPALHEFQPLDKKLAAWSATPHIIGCVERADAPHISQIPPQKDYAFLIGPVGGFSAQEREFLTGHKKILPASLGENILRAETAAMLCAIAPAFSRAKR